MLYVHGPSAFVSHSSDAHEFCICKGAHGTGSHCRSPGSQAPAQCASAATAGLHWPDTGAQGLEGGRNSSISGIGSGSSSMLQGGGEVSAPEAWVPPVVLVSPGSAGKGAAAGSGLPSGTLGDALATVAAWQRVAQAAGLDNTSALLPPTVLLFSDATAQPHVLERQVPASGSRGSPLRLAGPLLIIGPLQQQPSEAMSTHRGAWVAYQGMPVVNASRSSASPDHGVELVQGPLLLRRLMLVDLPPQALFGQGAANTTNAAGAPANASRSMPAVPLVTLPSGASGGATNSRSDSGSNSSVGSGNSSAPRVILEQVAIELGSQDFGPPLALALLPGNTTAKALVAAAAAAGLGDMVRKILSSSSSLLSSSSGRSAAPLAALQGLVKALQQPTASQLSHLELAYLDPQGLQASSAQAASVCKEAGRVCVHVAQLEADGWSGTDLVLACKEPAPGELAWWQGQNLTALTDLASQMLRGELRGTGAPSQEAGREGSSGGTNKSAALAAGLGAGLGGGLGTLLLLLLGISYLRRQRQRAAGPGDQVDCSDDHKGAPAKQEQAREQEQEPQKQQKEQAQGVASSGSKGVDVEAQHPDANGTRGSQGSSDTAAPKENSQQLYEELKQVRCATGMHGEPLTFGTFLGGGQRAVDWKCSLRCALSGGWWRYCTCSGKGAAMLLPHPPTKHNQPNQPNVPLSHHG